MAVRRADSSLQLYVKQYLPLFIYVSVLFLMGVLFGALLVNALTMEQRDDLSGYVGGFIQLLEGDRELGGRQTFIETFVTNLKWLALIWLFGISIIGLPLILILDFLKGVIIGFTVGYLVGDLSWKGFVFALVSVAPQNLLVIPAIIMGSVSAIAFSIYLVKNRILNKKNPIGKPGQSGQTFISYSTMTVFLMFVVLCASLLEAYISPVLMKWVAPFLLA